MANLVYVLIHYPEVVPLTTALVLFAIVIIRYARPDEEE